MSIRDFTANVISATKVVPDGNFKTSAASGVWDINEALDLIKGGNWPNAANIDPASFVDALFQTHLYEGNGSSQTITNGIDLSGKGGLVWIKNRDDTENHGLVDTEVNGLLFSNLTNAANTGITHTFNSNGFTVGSAGAMNDSSDSHVSWTFRKQPKFFDIVTYTGNNTNQTISHNLGSVPGMIIVKRTDGTPDWGVYHRGANGGTNPEQYLLKLNQTNAESTSSAWNDTAPTDSVFSVGGGAAATNVGGGSYVAYLFAHNNDDGGFGEPGDQDIIKCGSYTGNGSTTGPTVDLGFEPQWVMIKNATSSQNWVIFDNMRGMPVGDTDPNLNADENGAEATNLGNTLDLLPNGFQLKTTSGHANTSGATYIYMAIRRGGMQTPTSASDVFAIDTAAGTSPSPPLWTSGFVTDFALHRTVNTTNSTRAVARLTGENELFTNLTNAEGTDTDLHWDFMDGFHNSSSTNSNQYAWMWKRARGYFDVVTYSGTGSARTVSHNLGVAPEMMWIKRRNNAGKWAVYHKDNTSEPETEYLILNYNFGTTDNNTYWNDTAPTSSVFTVGTDGDTNASGSTYIAYLFATVAGVSKVGSFTSDGSDMTIDCGFTSGASFVLLKRTDDSDDWFIFRDIVAGNDKRLKLNTTDAEATGSDNIDPDNSGFIINNNILGGSGRDFIFYAIAAIS